MNNLIKSIIFIDIRGFTKTSDNALNLFSIPEFLMNFYLLIDNTFRESSIKYLGDGAMILLDQIGIEKILMEIYELRDKFSQLCENYTSDVGINLVLSSIRITLHIVFLYLKLLNSLNQ